MKVSVRTHVHKPEAQAVRDAAQALNVTVNLGVVDAQGTAKKRGIPVSGVARVSDSQTLVVVPREHEAQVQGWLARYGGTYTKNKDAATADFHFDVVKRKGRFMLVREEGRSGRWGVLEGPGMGGQIDWFGNDRHGAEAYLEVLFEESKSGDGRSHDRRRDNARTGLDRTLRRGVRDVRWYFRVVNRNTGAELRSGSVEAETEIEAKRQVRSRLDEIEKAAGNIIVRAYHSGDQFGELTSAKLTETQPHPDEDAKDASAEALREQIDKLDERINKITSEAEGTSGERFRNAIRAATDLSRKKRELQAQLRAKGGDAARDAIFQARIKDYDPKQLQTEMRKQGEAYRRMLEAAARAKNPEMYKEFIEEAKKIARNAETLRSMITEHFDEYRDCSMDGLLEWLTNRSRLDE